jgi:hypothetical protein
MIIHGGAVFFASLWGSEGLAKAERSDRVAVGKIFFFFKSQPVATPYLTVTQPIARSGTIANSTLLIDSFPQALAGLHHQKSNPTTTPLPYRKTSKLPPPTPPGTAEKIVARMSCRPSVFTSQVCSSQLPFAAAEESSPRFVLISEKDR